MVYECEKLLSENGDKLGDADKANVNTAVEALKEALKGEDYNLIKNRQEELTKVFYEISEKLYKAAAPEQGAPDFGAGAAGNPTESSTGEDGYYDASYTDVN